MKKYFILCLIFIVCLCSFCSCQVEEEKEPIITLSMSSDSFV